MAEEMPEIFVCEEKKVDLPVEKLLGVALLGAIGSLMLFYLYQHLSEENKKLVKENIVDAVKAQMAKFSQQ